MALLHTATGKPLDGTAADENGTFALRNIAPGSYALPVSFVGYKQLEKTELVFTSQSATLALGNLVLTAASTQLGEVVGQGQRAYGGEGGPHGMQRRAGPNDARRRCHRRAQARAGHGVTAGVQ